MRAIRVWGEAAEIGRYAKRERELLLAAGCDRDLRGRVVAGAVSLVDKCADGLSEVDQARLRAVLVERRAARFECFGGHSPGDRRASKVGHALRHVYHAWA